MGPPWGEGGAAVPGHLHLHGRGLPNHAPGKWRRPYAELLSHAGTACGGSSLQLAAARRRQGGKPHVASLLSHACGVLLARPAGRRLRAGRQLPLCPQRIRVLAASQQVRCGTPLPGASGPAVAAGRAAHRLLQNASHACLLPQVSHPAVQRWRGLHPQVVLPCTQVRAASCVAATMGIDCPEAVAAGPSLQTSPCCLCLDPDAAPRSSASQPASPPARGQTRR